MLLPMLSKAVWLQYGERSISVGKVDGIFRERARPHQWSFALLCANDFC